MRVNAVCPGWVKTEMDAADQAGGQYNDADIEGVNPMGRFATPDDIARAILFLADPAQSGFINGHALAVDGGWTVDGSWQRPEDEQAKRSGFLTVTSTSVKNVPRGVFCITLLFSISYADINRKNR